MNCNYLYDISVLLIVVLVAVVHLCNNGVSGGATRLHHANVDMTLASNEFVMINFYADWCMHSNRLLPIFDEAADKVKESFSEPGGVVLGKVNCNKEDGFVTRFHISKYPTVKVIHNGQPTKREYRGQRSVEAIVEFVKKQLADPIREFNTLQEIQEIDDYNSRPEAVVQALQVLEVREQLENNVAGDSDMNSEEMDEGEKALLREMCNVVWRKLEEASLENRR